jgi:hypothetical protein
MAFIAHGNRTLLLLLALSIFGSNSDASLSDATNAFLQLQKYREVATASYRDSSTRKATLVNLNSNINTWYILAIDGSDNRTTTHNILATSDNLRLQLNPDAPELLIAGHSRDTYSCNIGQEISWVYRSRDKRRSTYIPICNHLLFIVIKQDGFRTMKERGAEVLRWLAGDAGEQVINEVKERFFQDKYLVKEQTEELAELTEAALNNSPLPRAVLQNRYLHSTIPTRHLGLRTRNSEQRLLAGEWYPLENYPDIYTSMITPGMVSREIQASHRDRVNHLDGIEKTATVFLMSFSLNRYTLGWGHGTDHPGVGWSPRARNIKKDNPYGPDGFNSMAPLIPIGHVPPFVWPKTIGTFSAGFQKRHGAFKYGKLSTFNKAHHYGFMEHGVLLVSPSEGLASVIMYKDGRVELKRWTAEDNKSLPHIRHLRQNGVPLIHRDENGQGIPGIWVRHWSRGNWSGSANKELRAPRGAACLIETPRENYLAYAFFSSATPSAMARVFQSYGCSFAIHLDLNSPGQAYASLFKTRGNDGSIDIELLMKTMHAYMGGDRASPRYFIKPDYKDFFYIMKRE